MSFREKTIKIVKRNQRESTVTEEAPATQLKTERQSNREIFKVVNSWIAEQREAKKEIVLPKGLC